MRESVDDVRARLERARLQARAGRLDDALTTAELARADATASAYAPVETEAEVEVATILVLLDRTDEAQPLLEHALDAALVQRNQHAAAAAAVELTGVLARNGVRAVESQWLARTALGLAQGDGTDPRLVSAAMLAYGEVFSDRELEHEAEPYLAGAVLRLEQAFGPDHPDLVEPLIAHAELVQSLGRQREAAELTRRALDIVERAFGPDHPQVAIALRQLGWQALLDRRFAEAQADFERAHEIAEAAFGPDHAMVWSTLGMRANALAEQHRYAEAVAGLEESLRRMDESLPEVHPSRASTLHNLAVVHALAGDHVRAVEILRETVRLRRAVGHQGPLAAGLGALGTELKVLERFDEAEPVLEEASRIEAAAHADDGLYYAYADTALADLVRRRGDLPRARAMLERALGRLSDEGDPGKGADMKFLLGQVLWDMGEQRPHAIELVEAALERVRDLPGHFDVQSAAEMRAWLDTHVIDPPENLLAPAG